MLTKFLLSRSYQNTSHRLYMRKGLLAGNHILISTIRVCLASFCASAALWNWAQSHRGIKQNQNNHKIYNYQLRISHIQAYEINHFLTFSPPSISYRWPIGNIFAFEWLPKHKLKVKIMKTSHFSINMNLMQLQAHLQTAQNIAYNLLHISSPKIKRLNSFSYKYTYDIKDWILS